MPADFGGQAYFAKDLGIFSKAGFTDATVTTLNSGAAITAATLSGTLDVGFSNTLSIAVAHDKGIPLVIIAAANIFDSNAPTVGFLGVPRSSSIRTGSDLAGKTIAITGLSNINEFATRNWIDTNGGDATKVKFVEIPNQAIAAAVSAGRVDGGIMNQGDYPTLGKADDPIRVVANMLSSLAPKFLSAIWFTTTDWIAKNPADAKAFVAAMREAAVWANSHRSESAVILAKYLKESRAAIEAAPRVVFATNITNQMIQPAVNVAAKYGMIKSAFPAKDFISPLSL
jgi:NitT/TauT family transport system substrate-binding protein